MKESGQQMAQVLSYAEDGIYLLTALLLAATVIVILISTGRSLIRSVKGGLMLSESLKALDALLLVLMIVELLHTIRLFIVEHALVPEPFLIVALIAGVRRILILTTEASQYIQGQPEQFRMVMIEMGLLVTSFLVIATSIFILRQAAVL
jgi:uncharacterized membrane protein (DUF373 family)